jgi:hypothetical protein
MIDRGNSHVGGAKDSVLLMLAAQPVLNRADSLMRMACSRQGEERSAFALGYMAAPGTILRNS